LKTTTNPVARRLRNPISFFEHCLIDPETGQPFKLLDAERAFLAHALAVADRTANMRELLVHYVFAHDEAGVQFLDGPRRREAAIGHQSSSASRFTAGAGKRKAQALYEEA
jgi:hypothetical protein